MRQLRSRPVASFFVLAVALTWLVWIPAFHLLPPSGAGVVSMVGAFGPGVAGALVVRANGGRVRTWLAEIAVWRVAPRWYVVALGLPVALVFGASALVALTGVAPSLNVLPERVPPFFVGFVAATLVGGGQEELGWRGFAQPRLQRRYGALAAGLIVGVVWALWHLPLYVMRTGPYAGRPFGTFAVFVLVAAVVFAWLYNSTRGSVLLVALMHGSNNAAQTLAPFPLVNPGADFTARFTLALIAVTALVAAVLVVRYGGRDLGAPRPAPPGSVGAD